MTDDDSAAPSEYFPASRGRRRWLRWGGQAALFLAVFASIQWFQGRELLPAGEDTPDFRLQTLAGSLQSDELRGKRVWLHFWATWCGVCRMEHDMLKSVHAGLDADEVLVSIVADANDAAAVEDYVRSHSLGYPVALASEKLLREFRVKAFPTNYFVDSHGRISSSSVGMSNRFAVWVRLAWASLGAGD